MFNNNSGNAAVFTEDQACPRCFTDNPSINNLYYRESEVHTRVNHDKLHLRDNAGPGDMLFTTVHHPMCYCEEH